MTINEIRQSGPGKMLIINGSLAIPDDPSIRAKYGVDEFLRAGGRIQPIRDDATGTAAARMQEMERRQHRAVRELLLDPNNAAAKKRLQDLEASIAALRVER